MTFRKLPIITIEWEDICSSSGWCEDKHAGMGTISIISTGFLLRESEDSITIAQSLDGNKESKTNERLTVMKSVVTKITHLRRPRKKK